MRDLERELVSIGASLDLPPAGDLTARVRAAVAEHRRERRRRLWVFVAALAGLGAVSVPVVAGWLRVGNVEVRREEPPAGVRTGERLNLGERSTLAAARAAVAFDIVVPTELGAPDEVWIDRSDTADIVWLAYRPGPDLPEAKTTGYAVLLAQMNGSISQDVIATKFVAPDTTVEPVTLGDGRALWIEGAHFVALRSSDGRNVVEQLRLSDDVLLWERGRVTLRLESVLGRDASLRIAGSVA